MADAPNLPEDANAPGAARPAGPFGGEAWARILGEIREVRRGYGTRPVDFPLLLRLPFVYEHVVFGMWGTLFIPVIYVYEAGRNGEWLTSSILGAAWAAALPPLALWFHRRGLMSIGITIIGWLGVVVLLPMAFLLVPP